MGKRLRYFGDYELLAEIARGGMGVVYKARQVTLNRTVAVKMILGGCLASPDDVKRFRVEAEAAAQLDHPGIVPIYEVGEHEGNHYYSMGFVDGQSLAARVTQGPLPPREAAALVRNVAEAVHYAHEKGVIHRDLKPGNVLLDEHGRPRVTDFGLAKLTQSASGLTGTGQILGTPSYMPPEQAAAQVHAIGRAADVYSMGAILYCLLTGRPPFQAATPVETLLQVQQQEPAAPRTLNPDVPLDLDTIALKCLDKNPQRRYESAQDLADELDRYLTGRPILARRVGRAERAWRWCKRNPVVAALSSTAAVLLTVTATVSSVAYFREADLRETIEGQASNLRDTVVRETNAKNAADGSARVAEARRKEAEEKTRLLRRALYLSDMKRVQSAWDAGQFATAADLLDTFRVEPNDEDVRGFEWWYWNRKLHDQRTLKGHSRAVYALAYSPDGTRIASTSADQTLKLWDVATGKQIWTFPLPGGNCLAFNRDGTRIIATKGGDTLVFCDANTGRELRSLTGASGLTGLDQYTSGLVTFSLDGTRIAVVNDQVVKIWNTETGQLTLTLNGHTNAIHCVTFSADGSNIATASADGTVRVWNANTGEQTLILKGYDNVVFSPSGKQLTSTSAEDNDFSVTLWDLATGLEVFKMNGHQDYVYAVAFSTDGTRIASAADDKTVRIWDAATGKENLILKGHTETIWCVAFSPDGRRIASAGDEHTLKHWDAVTSDETLMLKANTEQLKLPWAKEHIVARPQKNALSLAFSPDGTRLVAGTYDNTIQIWNTNTATCEETLTLQGGLSHVVCVAYSADSDSSSAVAICYARTLVAAALSTKYQMAKA
jgi:eukaryotic-like serine/threonine-protein kinase